MLRETTNQNLIGCFETILIDLVDVLAFKWELKGVETINNPMVVALSVREHRYCVLFLF